MLIACNDCHRQYDVGAHDTGSRVLCFCGARLTVPEPRSREMRMQHCASCGAGLDDGATTCGFCRTAVSLGDRGLGETCPECLSRMVGGAEFCSTCGIAIRPAIIMKALSDRGCPRCGVPMTECEAASVRFAECTACGGLWLGDEVVKALVTDRERSAAPAILAAAGRKPGATEGPTPEAKVSYLPCPVCRDLMNRQNFGRSSGVIVDWCRGHGFWFDADELAAVFRFVSEGGLDEARSREIERLESKRRELNRMPAPNMRSALAPSSGSLGSVDVFRALAGWLARLF